jgi:pyruvate ferredoxin oxidoreductase alpha subunit
LKDVKAVGVMDRATSPGAYGAPLFNEVRTALYDCESRPVIVNYVYGIGGRDLSPHTVKELYSDLLEIAKGKKPSSIVRYVGVRS